MDKTQDDLGKLNTGSMLSQKTNEDYNKEAPNPSNPNSENQKTAVRQMKGAMKTYTCSMHPEIRLDKPGKCPTCGMELVEKN